MISLSLVVSQNFNISDCSSFQSILTNNSSVYYSLVNDIDCTGLNISVGNPSLQFKGIFDGQGYSIINYNLVGNNNGSHLGLFANGLDIIVKNITFININITSTSEQNFAGAIFGYCNSCTMSDIIFNSTLAVGNIIKVNMNNVGLVVGQCLNCIITNIFVQNTIVDALDKENVGGLFGFMTGIITNCHNLGFSSNPSVMMVRGKNNVGGMFGIATSSKIIGCGVSNVLVNATGGCVGGLIGIAQNTDISDSYVKSSVSLQSYLTIGGLVGKIYVYDGNFVVNNSYTRANISSSSGIVGGFAGRLSINTFNSVAIQNSYSSNIINGLTGNVSASIGYIDNTGSCYLTNFYFNNQTNTFPAIANGNCSAGTFPVGLSCDDLYTIVDTTFDQLTVWYGNNLRKEHPLTFGSNTCPFPVPSTPSTTTPSTTTPSTTIPSTTSPSTFVPSTNDPFTTPLQPSTSSPSTEIPSTLIPPTLTPSTTEPSTTYPSTLTPSTTVPSTTYASTLNPNILPICLYEVLNCENCGMKGLILNASLFDISCVLNGNVWGYQFIPLSPNTTTTISQETTLNQTNVVIEGNLEISKALTLNGSSLVVFGNFNQTSESTITLVLNSDSNNENGALNVSGCVTLNGNLSLTLEIRPEKGTTKIILINYNCSQPIQFLRSNYNQKQKETDNRDVQTIQTSKFSVKPTYVNNKCDKIESKLNDQQGTLSVSLSTTSNGKCGGISQGAIIGIVLGIVGGSLVALIEGFISL